MKFSYKFSNLLGAIYRNGNLQFTPDGNSIISPVGNRLSIYDLRNHKSRTLSLESRYNYVCIALSPDGSLLIAVNEVGEAQLISLISCTIIHRHKLQNKPQCVVFSPDGAYFAVAMDNIVLVFSAPGELTGEYSPFLLKRRFLGGFDDVTWLDWSSDSRFLAVGCRDGTTKIVGMRLLTNFRTYILAGHSDGIFASFFERNSMHVNTLGRKGQLCLWECSCNPSDIEEVTPEQREKSKYTVKKKKIAKTEEEESEDDVDDKEKEKDDNTPITEAVDENEVKDANVSKGHPFVYKKLSRHYLADEPRKTDYHAYVTAANYNNRNKILVVAFNIGTFYLYELPDVNMIHSLSISDYAISVALFNGTGDWVALASRELGQLLVWEWQSEQYIMKQQGHSSEMTCISYSADGQYIATGGEDSKVKLWNTQSGFCFVTFSEHSSGITGVQFSRSKNFLVSASLDGTVRAFDVNRYRNFRTFSAPERVQFSCVAIDHSSEFVVAGCQDVFEMYLWSVKLGKLLEVISGHEGPVCSVSFSPVATMTTLVSGSWDKTIKVWNCLESNSEHETIDVLADATCVTFSPSGENVAVATLNGHITIFDVKTATQISSIEGRNDLAGGRYEADIITGKKNLEGKYFTSIEYSVDGECILAGGNSQYICIYHAREAVLLKKFEITQNHSLDGLNEYINRRNLTEFGNMALVETREELEGGNVAIGLPGVQKGDMASRNFKPKIKVYAVRFMPTGQAYAVATTEGLCLYSLDKGVVFDPFHLSLEVTPKAIHESVDKQDFSQALLMSLKLNEPHLIYMVLEKIPRNDIKLICSTLPETFAPALLQILARGLQTSRHLEFYLEWCTGLLTTHGNKSDLLQHHALLSLQESLSQKYESLNRICDFNKYTMRVLLNAAKERRKQGAYSTQKKSNGVNVDDYENADDDDMFLIRAKSDDEVAEFEEEDESDSESSAE
ncbi:PREDICTED: periodic tryptophan protein 2 homolog [Bactrocera latifrons]|uniref:Periodic tryptophan protein 2 n=1 Tax=Bactrocera latifrons TaxID=174628 RepID=A0A0K8V7W6_BACLA|nr:PREDICTED: periodic tryptophan protein 2 homolog [Bactrocera latifrons]